QGGPQGGRGRAGVGDVRAQAERPELRPQPVAVGAVGQRPEDDAPADGEGTLNHHGLLGMTWERGPAAPQAGGNRPAWRALAIQPWTAGRATSPGRAARASRRASRANSSGRRAAYRTTFPTGASAARHRSARAPARAYSTPGSRGTGAASG